MTSPICIDDRYEERDQLRDQLRQLLRYPVTIAVGIVLGLVGGLVLVLLRAGSYTSTAEVLVRSKVDPFSTYGVSIDNQLSMGTERQIGLSAAVAARAAKALGEPSHGDSLLEDLNVTNPPETQVLSFDYTAGSPQRAARVANAFAEAYLADRKDRTQATVERMTGGLEQQITVLAKRATDKGTDASAGARRDQINALQKRISDIRSFDTSGGDIVRTAEPPARPSGPGPATLLGFGMLIGVLLGLVLAWLRSALEPRVRSVGEVQTALGAPVLGLLPAPGTSGELLLVGQVTGGRTEAYRSLAFRLRHGRDDRATAGTLLVVAPKQNREAEATAVNLAAAFAEFGDEVLLVDATASTPGLAERLPLVVDDSGAGDEAADVPGVRKIVDAGTAGRFQLAPDRRGSATADVPASAMVADALPDGSGRPTLVVTRPLLEHTDALAVAQRVDGVLVVGSNHTRREDLKRVRELISCAGGHIVGAVLVTSTLPSRPPRLKEQNSVTAQVASADPSVPEQPQQGSSAPDDTLTASR